MNFSSNRSCYPGEVTLGSGYFGWNVDTSARRSISVLKVVHSLLVSDSFSGWKLSLKEYISALNVSQLAFPCNLIFLFG